jgi:hypothetical protein
MVDISNEMCDNNSFLCEIESARRGAARAFQAKVAVLLSTFHSISGCSRRVLPYHSGLKNHQKVQNLEKMFH